MTEFTEIGLLRTKARIQRRIDKYTDRGLVVPQADLDTLCTLERLIVEMRCSLYIKLLGEDSPIVSVSHIALRELYDMHGQDTVDAEIERQFNELNGE